MDLRSLPRSIPGRLAPILVSSALFALAAAFAFYRLFGTFRLYDDEGYAMISVASFDRGFALYDEVFTQYGPFFYLATWLTFLVPGFELGSATVRLLVAGVWLSCSLLCAAFVHRACRSASMAAITFVGVFWHLRPLANEPGHPQGMAVLLVSLALAITPTALDRRPARWAALLGVLCAALVLTKTNLGTYLFLSAALGLATSTDDRVLFTRLRPVLWFVVLFLPLPLMRFHLGEPWAQTYAASFACTAVTTAVWLWQRPKGAALSLWHLLGFATAFVLAIAVFAGFALVRGTTWTGLARGLVGQHLQFPSMYTIRAPLELSYLACSAGSLLLCATLRFLRRRGLVLALCKLAFGALVFVWTVRVDHPRLLACAGPFLWLTVAVPDAASSEEGGFAPHDRVGRVLVVLIALLQLLHAYPVAGSQITWATFLLVPAAAVCSADAAACVAQGALSRLSARGGSAAALPRLATVLVVVALAGWLGARVRRVRAEYRSAVPLELPGTQGIRLPEIQVAIYRWLAHSVAAADAFYTIPGFNSLYFWAEKEPPSLLNNSFWTYLFSHEQQRSVIAALGSHPRVAVVERTMNPPLATHDSTGAEEPLIAYLRTRFEPVGRLGLYELRASPGWTPPSLYCAVLRDGRVLVYVPALPRSAARSASIVDLGEDGRCIASTDPDGGRATFAVADEGDEIIALDAAGGSIDLSQPRRLTLLSSDAALWEEVRRASFPVVRLLDARGELLASIPFPR